MCEDGKGKREGATIENCCPSTVKWPLSDWLLQYVEISSQLLTLYICVHNLDLKKLKTIGWDIINLYKI